MPSRTKGIGLEPEAWAAPKGENFLLIIAVDEYVHCPKLNNCVKDAEDFMKVLIERYQFDPENTITLFNEEVTRPNLHTQLKALQQRVGPEDNLLIYFSGHGETESNVGYWVPVDAHPGHEWEYFSTDEIKRRLDSIDSFHTFVIADACFSGALFSSYKSVTPGYETKRSRWGLAASHSRERALDGTAGENSPFAINLLQQLRNSQERLSIQELATFVIRRVGEATEGRQTPIFKPLNVKGDDSGQFVFHLKISENAAWEAAKSINTIASYFHYNQNYPSGKYQIEALEAIRQLEEEESWQKAKGEASLSAFMEYQQRYPEGRFAREAAQSIQNILTGRSMPKVRPVKPDITLREENEDASRSTERVTDWHSIQEKLKISRKRWLPMAVGALAVLALAIWAISRYGGASPAQLKVETPIDTIPSSTGQQLSAPPKLDRAWPGGDQLAAIISDGTPPYTLLLTREDKEVYRTEVSDTGTFNIDIAEYRKEYGSYELRLEDAGGRKATKTITIDPPKILTEGGFGSIRLGGRTYRTVRLAGLTWTAENLDYKTGKSWCYADLSKNCNQYGRLYNWKTARDICRTIGAGWRLPTVEDWTKLQEKFASPEKAYEALIKGGNNGFDALLGGYRSNWGSYSYLKLFGNYWSQTELDADHFYAIDFDLERKRMGYPNWTHKEFALSCRCVRN